MRIGLESNVVLSTYFKGGKSKESFQIWLGKEHFSTLHCGIENLYTFPKVNTWLRHGLFSLILKHPDSLAVL